MPYHNAPVLEAPWLFLQPPRYSPIDPNAPLIMKTFPQLYHGLLPQSFILDTTPAYSLFDPHPFSESSDSDVFLPMNDPPSLAMKPTQSNPPPSPNSPLSDNMPSEK